MKKIRACLILLHQNAKKFNVQNLIIGNIISQVNANQIGEKGAKKLFVRAEDERIRRRLEDLKRWDNEDCGEGSSGGSSPLPPLPPPLSPQMLPSPPAFSLPKLPPTVDDLLDSKGGCFGTGSLNDVRSYLWDDAKFETDYI